MPVLCASPEYNKLAAYTEMWLIRHEKTQGLFVHGCRFLCYQNVNKMKIDADQFNKINKLFTNQRFSKFQHGKLQYSQNTIQSRVMEIMNRCLEESKVIIKNLTFLEN